MDSKRKDKARRTAEKAVDVTAYTIGGVLRLLAKLVTTVLLIIVTTGLLFTCVFAYYVKTNLSTELDVSLSTFSMSLSSMIWYTDSSGQNQKLTTLSSSVNRVWVDYDKIPKYMEHAAVAIEDKRFYKHKGVDWYRTAAAFANMFLSMKNDFGGSTITQQLIKGLTGEDEITVQRKILEIFRALEFEKTYTKEEIMEWYLNVVYFGEGSYGIGTAANTYFGKNVTDLNLAECASIIGITNNPSKYSPFVSVKNNKERQETILYEMYDQGYISYDEYIQAKNEELHFVRSEDEEYELKIYSYYEETVISDVLRDLQEKKGLSELAAQQLLYHGGCQIYSCLDMDIQKVVDSIYEDLSQLPQSYRASAQQLQSAIVIMDPYEGKIVALSGGTGEKTQNFGWNHATDARRPAGSSFKPVAVYGPAFDLGLITQSTKVLDADGTKIKLSGTSWYPRNSGGGYRGPTTIRQALISSLNTVSAQIMDKLTPAVSFEYLTTRLGFTLVDADRDYAPLSLGQLTNGVTVREMAQAFTPFVNSGIFTYARSYTRVTDSDGNIILENEPQTIMAFKENTAWNIANMLQAAATYGTGSEAYFGYGKMPVAGKTGTTSDNCDRWFVGFTPYYVAAVWTGYSMPSPMYFYGNPATQIWKKIMMPIHEGLEIKQFPQPILGAPTNIFGDVEESEEPTESPEESATPTPTPTPSSTPSQTPPPFESSPPGGTEPPATESPNPTAPVTDVPLQPVG